YIGYGTDFRKDESMMYFSPYVLPYSFYMNPMCQNCGRQLMNFYDQGFYNPEPRNNPNGMGTEQYRNRTRFTDHGKEPYLIDIEDAAEKNNTFRTALWTGDHLQVTLMSIAPGEDIGLEVHPDTDQFLRIEDGGGLVQMGNARDNITFERRVEEDDAIMVPAGTWHNVTNTRNEALKLYTIYAPPEHPSGTVHRTKSEAMAAE